MTTAFPGSNDSFSAPSNPSKIPLLSPGDSGRKHSDSHTDMGDAVESLETNASKITHDHSGSGKLNQSSTHQSADTDVATTSLHHTIGITANQGAGGAHNHTTSTIPIASVVNTQSSLNLKLDKTAYNLTGRQHPFLIAGWISGNLASTSLQG